MRIRTIKPAFWKNHKLATLDKADRLLAVALINYADDEGFFDAHEALIRGECFPFDENSKEIRRGLVELSKIGFVRLGMTLEGDKVGHIVAFSDHQKIDRPTPSKIKAKTIIWDDSPNDRRGLVEGSPLEVEVEVEGNREEGIGMSGKPDVPPPEAKPKSLKAEARDILAFLNEKAERVYQPVDANLEFIVARLKEGATATQCRQVIVRKVREWKADEKMSAYLRPATLFNREKFNQYAGELTP